MTRDALIAAYLEAYKALNGEDRPVPTLRYENGFFILGHRDAFEKKYRRKGIEQMLGSLVRLVELKTA